MLRLAVLLAVAGCASGHTHVIRGDEVVFRARSVGPARFVSVVDEGSRITRADASASFAMVLPGGDWLAMTAGALVRFSRDGATVRWAKEGIDVWHAVDAGGEAVVAVGTIADPAALNGQRRAMFRVDTTTGAVGWQTESEPVTRGAEAVLVRVGDTTVAATFAGATAVYDNGAIAWTEAIPDGTSEPLLVAAGTNVVIVRSPRRTSDDYHRDTPLRRPLSVRVVDAHTGIEWGSTAILPEGDDLVYGQAGVAGDGRIAIEAADQRVLPSPITIEGRPGVKLDQTSTPRLLVIEVRDPAHPTAHAQPMPVITEVPTPASLAAGEVVFIDRYAATGETLGLRMLDLAAGTLRRAPLLRPRRVLVGDGIDSFVQITHLARAGARLTFAGVFGGDVGALRARVEAVDGCEAQDFVECFNVDDSVTLSPFAGFVGAVGD